MVGRTCGRCGAAVVRDAPCRGWCRAAFMISGCWHDCDGGDVAAQLGLATLAFFGVLALWVLGLFLVRRSWRPFVLYLAGLVVLVRVVEFVGTRI